MSEPHARSWKHRLVTAGLVVLGSVAILYPAWLPEHPVLPTEEGAVEGLQLALLLASAAFWFGAARPAGDIGPFYKIMGAFSLAGALGEGDSIIESVVKVQVEILYIPLGLYVLWTFRKHRKHFPRFFNDFTSHPAAGFFASAFMMIYILARFLGTSFLWKATLGENYHNDIPETVQSYLELLACYLLLVGTIGLCLQPRDHDPTETD